MVINFTSRHQHLCHLPPSKGFLTRHRHCILFPAAPVHPLYAAHSLCGVAARGLCPLRLWGSGGKHSEIISKVLAPSSGGWADEAVITLFPLTRWSCWHLRLFPSKYNEVYYLPKFCSIWCLLQPSVLANEFLIKLGFSETNYIMFRAKSRKIGLRRKAPAMISLPIPQGRAVSHLILVGFPIYQCTIMFYVRNMASVFEPRHLSPIIST